MNRYEISRQDINGGPVRTIYTETLADAEKAFTYAKNNGAIFVEIFDMVNDFQFKVVYPKISWI